MRHHPGVPEPRTVYQRGRILAAIANEALTAQQLADKLHLTRDGINIHLKAMKAATPRQIYVASWVYNPKGGRPAPQYRPGNQDDAEYASSRAPTRHLQIDKQKARIMRALESKKMTILQLAELVDVSHQWTRHLISELREAKRVHIGGWRRQTAGIAPLYAIGDKQDVKKPKPKPRETYKQRMQRIKSTLDTQERHYVASKVRKINEHIRLVRAKPQGIFAALGI